MNFDNFFRGPTEKFLLEKLKKEGNLQMSFIFGSYSSKDFARSFIEKLVNFKIAKLEKGCVVYVATEH